MKRLIATALASTMLLGTVPLASAQNAPAKSGLETASSPNGPWTAGQFEAGRWVRCNNSEGETLHLSGGTSAKIAPGTVCTVDITKDKQTVRIAKGKLFCHIDAQAEGSTALEIKGASSQVLARTGDFVVQMNQGLQLHVFGGDAAEFNVKTNAQSKPSLTADDWTKGQGGSSSEGDGDQVAAIDGDGDSDHRDEGMHSGDSTWIYAIGGALVIAGAVYLATNNNDQTTQTTFSSNGSTTPVSP